MAATPSKGDTSKRGRIIYRRCSLGVKVASRVIDCVAIGGLAGGINSTRDGRVNTVARSRRRISHHPSKGTKRARKDHWNDAPTFETNRATLKEDARASLEGSSKTRVVGDQLALIPEERSKQAWKDHLVRGTANTLRRLNAA